MDCKKILGLNNIKLACRVGECFLPSLSWLVEKTVKRIMFELKTEELGGKGCIMWNFIIYSACQVVGNQRAVTQLVRNAACMGMKVILKRLLIGKCGGYISFRRHV
jgi:hypothetical protein